MITKVLANTQLKLIENAVALDIDITQMLNNTNTLVSGIIAAFGWLILLFGVVTFGLSFLSHDPSQKAMGLKAMIGGAIIASASSIVTYITATGA